MNTQLYFYSWPETWRCSATRWASRISAAMNLVFSVHATDQICLGQTFAGQHVGGGGITMMQLFCVWFDLGGMVSGIGRASPRERLHLIPCTCWIITVLGASSLRLCSRRQSGFEMKNVKGVWHRYFVQHGSPAFYECWVTMLTGNDRWPLDTISILSRDREFNGCRNQEQGLKELNDRISRYYSRYKINCRMPALTMDNIIKDGWPDLHGQRS